MSARFHNSRFARLATAERAIRRPAGALVALTLLAGPGAHLALGQAKTTGRMLPSKPVTVLKTDAGTTAGPRPLGVRPLYDGPGGVATQYQYFLGTSPVNGATVQQEVVSFYTSSDSASFVPTVGLRYGINYSVGQLSCTEGTQPTGTSSLGTYVQTCTATVTFAPLYPGGHRDALFVYDTDGKTVLTGGFLYGIGLAPQLMIQPGVTTNLHLPGYPYLYGSTTDEAGTYYVYSNNDYYTVTKQGVASVFATSVPNVGMLSIDGAGSIFSPAVVTQGGYKSNNSSGYEIQTAGTAGVAPPSLCYTSRGDATNNPVIVPETVCFDSPNAVAVGNLGTYYDADLGGESTYINGQYVQYNQGFLAQPYGSYTYYPDHTGTPTYIDINPLNQVLAPLPVPIDINKQITNAGGDLPFAYPLDSGNYSPYAMVVDPYENVFFADHNYGLAVWCGLGQLGLSSALTGSSNGCGGWGSSMVALTTQFNSLNQSMAVDAADTLYAGQSDVQMLSAANNYASPITTIGVSGGAGAVSLAPDGTVYVQGGINTINIIDRSQGSIDFGINNQQIPNPYTMTLYNGGNQPLTISSIAASGAGFSVAPTTTNGCTLNGVTVAVGTICQLQVTFTQLHTGTSTGAITITSNSLNQASTGQTIALSAELSGIYVTALPTPLNFGYVAPGSSATLPVTVTNYSVGSNSVGYGSTVAINSALSSSNPAYTVSPGTCSAPLASGASCQLQVTFNSGTTTTYPGTISWTEQITGNGPSQQISVPVSGTGVMPVSLTPTALAFGTVDVGTSSAPQTLTLINPTGNGPLSIGSITAVSGYLFTSTGSNPCGTTLADGASCTLGVIFSPVAVGSDNGVLAIKDSAGNSPQTVVLTGDGIFSPDFETIHITDLLSLVPSTLLPPDVEVIHITDKLSLVSSTLLPINEVLHVSDEVQQSIATGSQTTPTVTWPAASAIVYGTPLSAMQLNATASVAGTFVYSPAGGKVLGAGTQELTATFTPANTAMYATVVSSMPLTVLSAPMTVAISSYSRAFATANPAFSYSIGGYVNGDTSAAVSGAPVLSTTAVLHSPAGPYAINGATGTLSAANYSFSFVPGTLTVLGNAAAHIAFHPIPNVPLAIGKLTLTAYSTSGGLGQRIVYTVTGPASVSGNILTLQGTGQVKVTASQAGNTTFAAATPVSQTFTVTP